MASVGGSIDVVFCLIKSAASLESDVSETKAEEKLSSLIQAPSRLSQPSVKSHSPQPLTTSSRPAFLQEHLSPDASVHSLSDVSKMPQLTADDLLSHFAGQPFFHKYLSSCVSALFIYLFLNLEVTDGNCIIVQAVFPFIQLFNSIL